MCTSQDTAQADSCGPSSSTGEARDQLVLSGAGSRKQCDVCWHIDNNGRPTMRSMIRQERKEEGGGREGGRRRRQGESRGSERGTKKEKGREGGSVLVLAKGFYT